MSLLKKDRETTLRLNLLCPEVRSYSCIAQDIFA